MGRIVTRAGLLFGYEYRPDPRPELNMMAAMMETTRSWDELRRNARTTERTLEEKIAAYAQINRETSRTPTAHDEGEELV